MKIKTVLVPLDGSPLAAAALAPAMEFAKANDATLVLLRAAEAHPLPTADPTEVQVEVVRKAEEYLNEVLAFAKKSGVKQVETSVWYGPPAEAIIEVARFRNADLIVMSTHGRSGLGRLVLGSVAETVLRSTHTPIFLLRPEGAPVAPIAAGQARPAKEAANV